MTHQHLTVETLAQEHDRLDSEYRSLRKLEKPTSEQAARREQVYTRLRAIRATPPAGYTLPPAAAGLVAHAEAHGWQTLVQWSEPDYDGEPFVTVQVGRRTAPGELPDARSDTWLYQLTWHSRGCPPGRVRLFGSGLARTPDRPATHDAPSVRAVRAVISAHPAPVPA